MPELSQASIEEIDEKLSAAVSVSLSLPEAYRPAFIGRHLLTELEGAAPPFDVSAAAVDLTDNLPPLEALLSNAVNAAIDSSDAKSPPLKLVANYLLASRREEAPQVGDENAALRAEIEALKAEVERLHEAKKAENEARKAEVDRLRAENEALRAAAVTSNGADFSLMPIGDEPLPPPLAETPAATAAAATGKVPTAPSAEILTALDERLASVQSVEPPPTAANVAPHDRLFNWIRDPRSTELPPGADPDAGAALNADVRLALTALDDRLVKVLEAGDIRFVRSSWLLAQPDAYRIQKRQDLEALEQSGASPLLSPTEAVAIVRKGNRSAGILSYGCALCHGLQPKQPLAFSSCVLPVFPAVC